ARTSRAPTSRIRGSRTGRSGRACAAGEAGCPRLPDRPERPVPTAHLDRDPGDGSATHPSPVVALHRTLEGLGVADLVGLDAPPALHAQLSAGGPITPITVRDERSAAFMADGYAKVSGKPGVIGIGGVGATNAIQGVVESWLGSTPVVLVVEEGSAMTRHKN